MRPNQENAMAVGHLEELQDRQVLDAWWDRACVHHHPQEVDAPQLRHGEVEDRGLRLVRHLHDQLVLPAHPISIQEAAVVARHTAPVALVAIDAWQLAELRCQRDVEAASLHDRAQDDVTDPEA